MVNDDYGHLGIACPSWLTAVENSKWRIGTAITLTIGLGILFAGIEVLLVFVIKGPYGRGVSWPVTFVGILAAVLLIIGYLPVPFEVVNRRGHVVGIDFAFLTIDWLGAFFSLISLGLSGADTGSEACSKG